MSAREFKRGDVGTSRYGRVFNTDRGWVFDDDSGYTTTDKISGFRPLVVIDPEDREQVDGIRDLYDVAVIRMNDDPDPRDVAPEQRTTAMQVALRDLADPKPRIEEPTGLGAVVEDAGGTRWVHLEQGIWFCLKHGRENWADIDAVRVLHEGWWSL